MNNLQKIHDFSRTIEKLQKSAANITEGSYYRPFQDFLEGYLQPSNRGKSIQAIAQESTSAGIPDITVRDGDNVMGWIEVKAPQEELSNKMFHTQFEKYKASFENLVITNFRQWQLWQWNSKGESVKNEKGEVTCDLAGKYTSEQAQRLARLLQQFVNRQIYVVREAKDLALALARKTRVLSNLVETYEQDDKLQELKLALSKTLLIDLQPHAFANLVAETLSYSLFLAAMEHRNCASSDRFTLTTATDFLPKNVPLLNDLFELVKRISKNIPDIHQATELLVDQLQATDLATIRWDMVTHKPNEDPVIHFYEPFLKEYDEDVRKNRGVYYTPKPVVDFIVRSVDHLLEHKFGKAGGLADEEVKILDPSTGTATFLMAAIQQVHARIEKNYGRVGEAKAKFAEIVKNHILKNFYGFELLFAPYTIAHLKLTLEIEQLGVELAEQDRFQIYLANTLNDPETDEKQKEMTGFSALPEEAEQARKIKQQEHVLAIIGNPPYSVSSQNPSYLQEKKEHTWIGELMETYKKNLKEQNIKPLQDDYIKFIRFAQWKITEQGKGIFAMITANSFLDGITHRQMRGSILETFDEIYIYNLHGNSRKGEKTPHGDTDENVFAIQTGVSINIFIKKEQAEEPCRLYYADAWGKQKEKFATLQQYFAKVDWQEIAYNTFNQQFLRTRWSDRLGALNFFLPSTISKAWDEYGSYWGVKEIFVEHNSGVKTHKDTLTIQFEQEKLQQIITDFQTQEIKQLREKYPSATDSRDWKLQLAQSDLQHNKPEIVDIAYRPFDTRKTLYTGKTKGFVAYPRKETMQHMLQPNLGLVTTRLLPTDRFYHSFCTTSLADLHVVSDQTYLFPLYLYPEKDNGKAEKQQKPLALDTAKKTGKRTSGLTQEYTTHVANKLGTQSDRDIFSYIYAVLHCSKYRIRYAEQLKIDFPRLPLTSDIHLFKKLVKKGNELINLHLLGENPFDNSAANLFAKRDEWGVKTDDSMQKEDNWRISRVEYQSQYQRVYVNGKGSHGQFFEGVDEATWEFMIGGYQVLSKWLKDRKDAKRFLSSDDRLHYMKIVHALRRTQAIMDEIDAITPAFPW